VDDRRFFNIDQDNFSSHEIRNEIVAILETAASIEHAKDLYDAFREKAQADGKVNITDKAFEPEERVGRLRYRPRYASDLADQLRNDPSLGGVDETEIDEVLNWVFGLPSAMETPAARFLFDRFLASKPIESQPGWWFRTPDRSPSPFAVSASCLPWQLGLRFVTSGSEYISFEAEPQRLNTPRAATFLDVDWDMHDFWRPNGATEPLASTPATCDRTGLEELIAGPPVFRDVTVPTSIIKAA
jgi:hypothetical protein